MSYSSINYLINNLTKTNSVSNLNCSKLFKQHQPADLAAWKAVIDKQEKNINWLLQHAYSEQKKYNHQQFSEKELLGYLQDLYYHKTYYGLSKELLVAKHLNEKYPDLSFELDDELDSKFAVDIVIKRENQVVGAIQVKPDTYQHSGYNEAKNERFKQQYEAVKQVFYLFYNKQSGWINGRELTDYLRQFAE